MFTGIVEEKGEVVAVDDLGTAARLTLSAPSLATGLKHGDSVAVNGVCLTAVGIVAGSFTADVMKETLDRSSLGGMRPGDPVNLERAMALGDRLAGHLVQGHVDAVGTIRSTEPAEHWTVVRIGLPSSIARYVVEKGSVTVDGVSLTVTDVTNDDFGVSLIPTTLGLTTLGTKGPGDPVNLEVDVLAKYVERLLAARA